MKTDTLKLFCVTFKGTMKGFSPAYVVAKTPNDAYKKAFDWLTEHKYGYSSEREMDSITLVAEDSEYTDAGSRLFF